MNRMKVHNTVEYLKMVDFYHDTFDIEDGIDKVLAEYDVYQNMSAEELWVLERELQKMAQQNEFREIAHVVTNEIAEVI
jgi:hypothetical protein